MNTHEPPILVIGVGNDARGDDAVGLDVARRVQALHIDGVRVIGTMHPDIQLIDLWQNYALVIIIDAVSSGAPPGTIHRLDPHTHALPTSLLRCSSHSFGVAEALELARALQQLPPCLIIYGIEGRDFGDGEFLSAEVSHAAEDVVAHVYQACHSYLDTLVLHK